MGIINIAEIRPEMVLAGHLRLRNKRLLLQKGTRLSLKNLRIMKMWGVVEADIEGVSRKDVEGNNPSCKDPEIMRAAEEDVRERFIHNDLEHPAIRELFRLCTIRRAEEIMSRGSKVSFGNTPCAQTEPDRDAPLQAPPMGLDPAQLLKRKINLSTLPIIFQHINDAIKKPTSSAREIAEVISKDTNMSARLLKIANSAFYGFPNTIETLSRAVAILGTNQLSTLALGIKIIEAFKSIPQDLIDMKSFWKHSVACGIISRILASHKNIRNTERLFVAGLIHDIGRLAMYNDTPLNANTALLKAKQDRMPLNEAERETLNFDHATLGAMLLKKWKLPMSLENITKHHHTPGRSQDPLEPSIVHFANMATNALGIGSSGEWSAPALEPGAWECLGLSPNVLLSILKHLDRQLDETFCFFYANKV